MGQLSTIAEFKTIVEAATGLITIAAFVVAGIWTYMLFVKHRDKFPRVEVKHLVMHKRVSDSLTLLRVEIRVANIGKILLELDVGLVRIQQLLPCAPHILHAVSGPEKLPEWKGEADWPQLDERKLWDSGQELEPGETDALHFDFFLKNEVESVFIYSYIRNVKKKSREIGWNTTIVHDLT